MVVKCMRLWLTAPYFCHSDGFWGVCAYQREVKLAQNYAPNKKYALNKTTDTFTTHALEIPECKVSKR